MRNISLDRSDYNNAQKRSSEFEAALSELESIASSIPSPQQELEEKLLAEHISDFLRNIPSPKRQVFIRRYWYGDSIKDIAALYRLSEGSVTSMLFRICGKLKKYLEKEGISP